MKKKIMVVLLALALVVPCLGTVSASCPSCGGPSIEYCSGILVRTRMHYYPACMDENNGTLYDMYNWMECMSYPEHIILVEGHTCYCSGCAISSCPGTGYCPY